MTVSPIWKSANLFGVAADARCNRATDLPVTGRTGQMSNHYDNPASMGRFGAAHWPIADAITKRLGKTEPYVLIWWIFLASVIASSSGRVFGPFSGPLGVAATVAGTAGCAWMWLFSRALFRPAKPVEPWTILAVGVVMAIESSWALTAGRMAGGSSSEFYRIAANAASLICIAAIVMVFIEALSGFARLARRSERRFRLAFVSVYALIIAVAIVWASNAAEATFAGRWAEMVLTGCAAVGVIGSRLAISFRRRFPLTDERPRQSVGVPGDAIAATGVLARRIREAIAHEPLLTTPGLKVANFADALGEQEYKITQCITGQLGYRNFNQFINAHRIDCAKRKLTDAENEDRSVSAIAFECGFNSIGPFNRAFKDHVGVTPSEFRAEQRARAG